MEVCLATIACELACCCTIAGPLDSTCISRLLAADGPDRRTDAHVAKRRYWHVHRHVWRFAFKERVARRGMLCSAMRGVLCCGAGVVRCRAIGTPINSRLRVQRPFCCAQGERASSGRR